MTEILHNQGDTNVLKENKVQEGEFKPKLSDTQENVVLKDPSTTFLKNVLNVPVSPNTSLENVPTTTTTATSTSDNVSSTANLNETKPIIVTQDTKDEYEDTSKTDPTNSKLKFNTATFAFRMIIIVCLIVVLSSIVATRGKFAPVDSYEVLGDQRKLISWIPNTMDVLSNLPFLLVGILGAFITLNVSNERIEKENERINYLIFFISIGMATFGSGYYFWKPHTKRLFWHRLPRAISFTSLFYIMITEKFDKRTGGYLMGSLITFGFISVVYWIYTEMNYRGDLYILLQFALTLVSPFILHFYESRYTHSEYFYGYFILGILSKFFESLDVQIFNITGHRISGHTIHHLLSCLASLSIALMLPMRTINNTIKNELPKKKTD